MSNSKFCFSYASPTFFLHVSALIVFRVLLGAIGYCLYGKLP